MIQTLVYQLHDLLPYVNWLYFFHAWGMPPKLAKIAEVHDCPSCRRAWVESQNEADHAQAVEAERLHREVLELVRQLDTRYAVRARFGLFSAWSEEDDLLVTLPDFCAESKNNKRGERSVKQVRLPFLRQQKVTKTGQPYLCLSDFVAPQGVFRKEGELGVFPVEANSPRGSAVGVFATAVDASMEQLFPDDDYRRMLVQTLCDRMAEAAAEKMHEEVRRKYWGYAPEEHLTSYELFSEKYEGRRPAVGYPSMPDMSFNFLIDELIDMGQIGIRLTENGMMRPHAAVSGLMFDHPASRHFSVGVISEEQLEDYARRRGYAVEECHKFLASNLRSM